MPDYPFADPVVLTFIVIPVLLVAALLWGVAAASRRIGEPRGVTIRTTAITLVAAAIWMAVTWAAAARGALLDFDSNPPPFALLVGAILLLAVRIGLTRYGRRLALGVPLWALVGVQAFRLPLELAMHALAERGVMPVQMSYSGRNFDIITGITALVVAGLLRAGVAGRGLVLAWNVLGLALLVNIVTVAILSTPRFRYFGDEALNTFVMHVPFVWLPAVMVLAALAGHLVVFRAVATGLHQPPRS
jgi:hypothetical protein